MSVLISPAVPAQSTPNLLHPVISLVPPTLVVIDATLDGASAFASAVRRDAGQTTVLMLHPSATLRESLTQVAIALHSDPDLQRLVLVAHGEPGAIYFGENALTADSLVHHAGVVSAWDVPEMILCSCQVGVDAHFLEQLAAITASRVVASTDPLGNGVWLPQMWDLFEHSLLQHYSGTLAPKVSQGFRNANTSGTRTPVASRSTSTGDFNGDGNVDLVSTFPGTNRIAIALGDGSAGFTSSTPIDGFILPQAVSVGDFNGDSQPDLAIATYDRAVVVLLGNSSGGFSTQTTYTVGANSQGIVVADFNGDRQLDIATANYAAAANNSISVLLGNGSGGFSQQIAVAAGGTQQGINVGDFNGDNQLDLVVTNYGAAAVTLVLGDGSGNFGASTSFATGDDPHAVSVGDFNNDGQLDLAIANAGDDTVSVLLGNGRGSFSAQTTFTTGTKPLSVTVNDFDGDGNLDLATANNRSDNLSLLLGDGRGGFRQQLTFATDREPTVVVVGDFSQVDLPGAAKNADLAVVTSASTISVLLNEFPAGVDLPANGFYTPTQSLTFTVNFTEAVTVTGTPVLPLTIGNQLVNATYRSGSGTRSLVFQYSITTDDLDTDGITLGNAIALNNGTIKDTAGTTNADLALPMLDTSGILVDGIVPKITDDISIKSNLFGVGLAPRALSIADFNQDGSPDLATANRDANTISVLLNDRSGGLTVQSTFAVGMRPEALSTGDFNGDGKADLAIANRSDDTVSIRLGNGSGSFSAQTTFAVGNEPMAIAVADLNGDRQLDLVVANRDSARASLLLGNGSGGFSQQTLAVPDSTSVRIGDFNGDSQPDLVMTNPNAVFVLLNTGSGSFSQASSFAAGTAPRSINVGDFDGDGQQDIVVANDQQSGTVSVILGDGSGSFGDPTAYDTGAPYPSTVTVTDFNGDGNFDFTVLSPDNDTATLLLRRENGRFNIAEIFDTGDAPTAIGVADFDQDGRPDVAIANSGSNNLSLVLNRTIPAVIPPAPGIYTAGQTLSFRLNFTEAVTVKGTPALPIAIDTNPVNANVVNAIYKSGSGSNQLIFEYLVTAGNVDADGITVANLLNLDNGTIEDAAGNLVDPTVPRSLSTAGIVINAPFPTSSPTSSPTPAPTPTPDTTGLLGTATSTIQFFGGRGRTRSGSRLRGTKNNDILRGTQKNDVIDSRVNARSKSTDKLYGLAGRDRLTSGAGNDLLDGGKGNDILVAGTGRDLLLGGQDDDKLNGGIGDDILVGGLGKDTLGGGAGKDMFVFNAVNEGLDTISDFQVREDVVDLRSLFNQPQFAASSAFAKYQQYVQVIQVGTNTEIKIDADGNGSGTTFTTIARLQNITASTVRSRNIVI